MSKNETSLRSRLLILVTAIVSIMIVLEILIAALWYQNRYSSDINSSIEFAHSIGLTFETFVWDVLRQESSIGNALSGLYPYTSDEAVRFLQKNQDLYRSVRIFSIVDSTGEITLSSRPELIGTNVADREYFQKLKTGDSTAVSDFLLFRTENIAGFIIARGFSTAEGKLDFAVTASVQADSMGELALSIEREPGSYMTLFDSKGTLVFTNQNIYIPLDSAMVWKDRDRLLSQALQGKTATGFFSAPVEEDSRRIGVRVPIAGFGWVAGCAESQAKFFRPIFFPLLLILVFSAVIAGVALFTAIHTVRSISSSLALVEHHVQNVSRGEFGAIEPSTGLNEFNNLIRDTNTMAAILKDREMQIKKNEDRFRSAVDNLLDAYAILDPIYDKEGRLVDFRFEYVNKVALRLAGMQYNEMIGRSVNDLFPFDVRKNSMPQIENVLKTGEPVSFNSYPVSAPFGIYRKGVILNVRVSNLNGKLSIAWQDVTAAVESERALRESEEKFRNLADNMSQFAWMADHNGEIVWFNKRWYDYSGTTFDEVKGWEWMKFNHPDHIQRVSERITNCIKKGIFWEDTFPLRGKNGQYRWFLSRAVPIKNSQGKVIRWFGTNTDITGQRLAEQKLRESEKRFRDLANSMPQLVWTANPDGTVDYYNEKYRDFGGISPGLDGVWRWEPVIHEDDAQATMEAWKHSVETGSIYQIEHRIRHADGTFHWYLSRGIPVRNEKGEIIKWYGAATNIDISKEAQLALEKSENQLKALNQDLENLVAKRTEQVRALSKALTLAEQRERKRFSYILHENLQQLLFGARMLISEHIREHSMKGKSDENEDVGQSLSILDRALNTTKALSIELNPPILPSQGLDTALDWLINYMQTSYNLKVTSNISGAVNQIKGETQLMLTQMVRELLTNVVQHSGVLEAEIDVKCKDKKLEIRVSDKGRGFDTEEILKKNRSESKLGLFSIRERLGFFGGQLMVNSAIGKGTTCILIIPNENC